MQGFSPTLPPTNQVTIFDCVFDDAIVWILLSNNGKASVIVDVSWYITIHLLALAEKCPLENFTHLQRCWGGYYNEQNARCQYCNQQEGIHQYQSISQSINKPALITQCWRLLDDNKNQCRYSIFLSFQSQSVNRCYKTRKDVILCQDTLWFYKGQWRFLVFLVFSFHLKQGFISKIQEFFHLMHG